MCAVFFYVGTVLVSKLSFTSLTVSGREEPVSETAKVYQTEVVRGSFIHGSWKVLFFTLLMPFPFKASNANPLFREILKLVLTFGGIMLKRSGG